MTTAMPIPKLKNNLLLVAALTIIFLSALDGAATVFEVSTGRAIEANPVMAKLMDFSYATFISVKLLITVLGVVFLLSVSEYKLARVGIHSLAVMYTLVVFYHMFGLFL